MRIFYLFYVYGRDDRKTHKNTQIFLKHYSQIFFADNNFTFLKLFNVFVQHFTY